MERISYSLAEAFEVASISRALGYRLVKQGHFAPVHYVCAKPVVLRDELVAYLRSLPTVRTHKRGGAR